MNSEDNFLVIISHLHCEFNDSDSGDQLCVAHVFACWAILQILLYSFYLNKAPLATNLFWTLKFFDSLLHRTVYFCI